MVGALVLAIIIDARLGKFLAMLFLELPMLYAFSNQSCLIVQRFLLVYRYKLRFPNRHQLELPCIVQALFHTLPVSQTIEHLDQGKLSLYKQSIEYAKLFPSFTP